MSRSTKRPWVKQKGTYFRVIGNRSFRRKGRQITSAFAKHWPGEFAILEWFFYELPEEELELLLPDDPIFPVLNEVVDPYDICDWRTFRPADPEAYRK